MDLLSFVLQQLQTQWPQGRVTGDRRRSMQAPHWQTRVTGAGGEGWRQLAHLQQGRARELERCLGCLGGDVVHATARRPKQQIKRGPQQL
jgi:hypothetical protein